MIPVFVSFFNFSLKKKNLSLVLNEILGDKLFFQGDLKMSPNGYISLLKPQADKLEIQLNTEVKSIIQKGEKLFYMIRMT